MAAAAALHAFRNRFEMVRHYNPYECTTAAVVVVGSGQNQGHDETEEERKSLGAYIKLYVCVYVCM